MRSTLALLVMSLAAASGVSACSLDRAALSGRDGAIRDASRDGQADVALDAELDGTVPPDDAGLDAGLDSGPPDMGTDVGTDSGPPLPSLSGNTLWLDQRGQMMAGPGISSWADQSPGGTNSVSQASSSARPAAGASVAGWAAPNFDGVDDYMRLATNWDAVFGTMGGALWVVIDNTGEIPGPDDMASPWLEPAIVATAPSGGVQLGWSTSGPRAYGHNGTTCSTPRIAAAVGLHLLEVRYDGATFSLRLDARSAVTVSCPAPLTAFGPNGFLGRNYSGNRFFAGRIAALIGTNTVPSAADVAAVRAFLTARYGVSS